MTTLSPSPKTEVAAISCPLSPSCEAMALLDQTALRESSSEKKLGERFTDSLLDLRISFAQLRTQPEQALRSFFRLFPLLAKHDYLTAYRLRGLLKKEIQLKVSLGDQLVALHEIDFSWKNLDRLVTYYRNEAFEMATEQVDFDQLKVSFVWDNPTSA